MLVYNVLTLFRFFSFWIQDNLLIEENIAYDTKGHCFLLEDGIESGNRFISNLGAQTGIPKRGIPDFGPNGIETVRQGTTWLFS